MKIKDIINHIRKVSIVMIHKNGSSKSMDINELSDEELELEFKWFEVTNFKGINCLEFNL